ncbi:hypothetical protein [Ramlibacter algicola]|uniref:Uncharacterized protein n=1 Tax=Ramlibacter algicola TaxID=2795217 RepID=A0A934UP67_9BURK|nr:hypothetical protein [Ramlibacter algicola]
MNRTRLLSTLALAAALACTSAPALADPASNASTAASAISLLPVASVVLGTSVAVEGAKAVQPSLAAAGRFVVRGVEASGRGTVLVLEGVSDGARASVHVAGHVSVAVGSAVTTAALASGTVLSVAGQAIAFIPNEVGRTLLYNQVVVR